MVWNQGGWKAWFTCCVLSHVPSCWSFLAQGQAFFLQRTGDAPVAADVGADLECMRQQQALSLAYFDVFWGSAALAVLLVALVLLMRCSMAEKGAPLGPSNTTVDRAGTAAIMHPQHAGAHRGLEGSAASFHWSQFGV
jgi:hypothetical protein